MYLRRNLRAVWPPNASLYASSNCVHLRLLAGPFGQGLKMSKLTKKCMASGRYVGQRPDGHTFLCKFWHFQMAASCLLLGPFTLNLRIWKQAMRLRFKNVSQATVLLSFLLPVNVLLKAKVELHTVRRTKLGEIVHDIMKINVWLLSSSGWINDDQHVLSVCFRR